MCQGDSYKFHAAGREDIDVRNPWLSSVGHMVEFYCDLKYIFQVRMLGTGRPFLVEVQNARQVPSAELINQIEMKINNLEDKFVSGLDR